MKTCLIHNVEILPHAYVEKTVSGVIEVENGQITHVGDAPKNLDFGAYDEVIDGKGKLAIPGLVNAHSHAPMTILRNIANDMPLEQWLFDHIIPTESKLRDDDYYWGTMLAALEMVRSGTTCFIDMYLDMEQCAHAVIDSGLRANISKNTLTSTDKAQRGLVFDKSSFESFVKNYQRAYDRIEISMEIHSLYLYEPHMIEKSVELAREYRCPIHIHVLETAYEKQTMLEKYQQSVIKTMDKMGFFEVPIIAAHMVHVDQEDMEILQDKIIYPVHNPTSNCKLGSGIAPVTRMLQMGMPVCLGTDGAASNNNLNMFEEMHLAALLQKGVHMDPQIMKAEDVFAMATKNGAMAAGFHAGKLEKGYDADIVLLQTNEYHHVPWQGNTQSSLVYNMQAADVDTVIINGRTLMKNGIFLEMDAERIVYECEKIRKRLENGG